MALFEHVHQSNIFGTFGLVNKEGLEKSVLDFSVIT